MTNKFRGEIKLSPNDLQIKYQLGVANKELKLFQSATIYFEDYVSQNSNDAIAFWISKLSIEAFQPNLPMLFLLFLILLIIFALPDIPLLSES